MTIFEPLDEPADLPPEERSVMANEWKIYNAEVTEVRGVNGAGLGVAACDYHRHYQRDREAGALGPMWSIPGRGHLVARVVVALGAPRSTRGTVRILLLEDVDDRER